MQNEQTLIKNWIAKNKKTTTIEKLPGDASSRRYYRVKSKNNSYIVMKLQEFIEQGEQLPFIQVQRHLFDIGVNVPEIIDVDPVQGMILLKDLGDETLLKRLDTISKTKDQIVWFKKAIDLLLKMQITATRKTAPIDAYGLYFDEEKLMWEVRFTLAYFYNDKLARIIPKKDLKTIEANFEAICKVLANQEWWFTHRDYHSRNIMVLNDKLFMIDFQDARLGCPQYDLASLLRDSYYQLEEDVVDELIEYYVNTLNKQANVNMNPEKFREVFDLMAIQRNFKAIGSFASFYSKRGDVRYLKFIGNTFENIRRNLRKFPQLDDLRSLLYRYYYF